MCSQGRSSVSVQETYIDVPEFRAFYAKTPGFISITGSCFAVGIVYVILQWNKNQEILDSIFVSMLIAATMILMFGVRSLHKYMVSKGISAAVAMVIEVMPTGLVKSLAFFFCNPSPRNEPLDIYLPDFFQRSFLCFFDLSPQQFDLRRWHWTWSGKSFFSVCRPN